MPGWKIAVLLFVLAFVALVVTAIVIGTIGTVRWCLGKGEPGLAILLSLLSAEVLLVIALALWALTGVVG